MDRFGGVLGLYIMLGYNPTTRQHQLGAAKRVLAGNGFGREVMRG